MSPFRGSGGAFRVSSSRSDGTSRVSCPGSNGVFCVSSGFNGAFCVSSLRFDGASRVSSSRSDGASHISGGASLVVFSGPGGASGVSSSRSSDASCVHLSGCGCCSISSLCTSSYMALCFRLIHLHPTFRRGLHHQRRYCRACQIRQLTSPSRSPPHWLVVAISIAGIVFCALFSLGCASMRCASIISCAFAATDSTVPYIGLRLTSVQGPHWLVATILIASAVFAAHPSAVS